jgi:hypothetical protein
MAIGTNGEVLKAKNKLACSRLQTLSIKPLSDSLSSLWAL